MTATVHIAGQVVIIGGHLRQLCAWCGHRLLDVDLACVMAPIKEDGSPPDPYGTWETNALVEVDGHYSGVVKHDGSLPANACSKTAQPLRLVPALASDTPPAEREVEIGSTWRNKLYGHMRLVLSVRNEQVRWIDAGGFEDLYPLKRFLDLHEWVSDASMVVK